MNILGIAGQEADAAAALIRDGVVVAAIEEEKLVRVRHAGMNFCGGLPERSVEFCLKRGGISYSDLDYIAYYIEPFKLFRRTIAFRLDRALRRPGISSFEAVPNDFVEALNNLRQRRRTRRLAEEELTSGRFVAVNHQLAHAAGAFYPSGFERAAILVAGHVGDMTALSLSIGSKSGLEIKSEAAYPHSLGLIYGAVTAALGFDATGDEHKTMWLAATGENKFRELFRDMITVTSDGLPRVNLDYLDPSFRGAPALSRRFFDKTGLEPRQRNEEIKQLHRDIAASLQSRLEDVLIDIASRYRERTGEDRLCLAGGVALNSLAVRAVEKQAGFEQVFVQPASGNAGCSIGAALYLWHDLLSHRERPYRMKHVYLGPQFDEEEIKNVLDNCKLDYDYFLTEDKLVAEVAQLLSNGRIMGWFRGAMEFGPRTLGARSILASPVGELMRDNLNRYIKHREDFRPFSAAVPEERVNDFFEPSQLTHFLQSVSRIKPEARASIPAALFGDGLVRVHTVSRETSATFWKLLIKFGEITGVPVLLNTSFNLFGEPVVSTPREAVRGFYCSGIDCLVIGNFLLQK